MPIRQTLDRIRAAHPACQGIGYADISTDMMLATSASPALPQERWDELASTAAGLLSGPDADLAAPVLSPGGDDRPHYAVLMDSRDVLVFIRSVAEPGFALCCLCTPGVDLRALMTSGQAALSAVAPDA